MSMKRGLHRAALLPDGRVLVTGGTTSFNSSFDITTKSTETTEIYDPATNSFSAGPKMSMPRVGHTMTTLKDSRILVAGGYTHVSILPFITDSAQVYVPSPFALGSFGSNIQMTAPRFGHTAHITDGGDVLVFGGAKGLVPAAINSVEEFDVGTSTFAAHGVLSVSRALPAVCSVGNGNFVVAGGATGSLDVPNPLDTVDVYNDVTGLTPFAGFKMNVVRGNFLATLLPNGIVLLAGGGEDPNSPNPGLPDSWATAELLSLP
jgi:hypothetical protein